ncbi:MAG: DUF6531 domain-containing protein [Candidatus Limnocylindria bacterium]
MAVRSRAPRWRHVTALVLALVIAEPTPGLALTRPPTTDQQEQGQLAAVSVLADSVRDHSGVHGQSGWYYGYLSGSFASTTFDLLRQWVPGAHGDWRDVWFLDRQRYRTQLWQDGGHPNTDGGVHWTTRRWISPVEGSLSITGRLAKGDTGGGDGVTGRVIVDGVVVFQQFIAATDGVGVSYSLAPSVKVGSTVDLAIEAGGTENFDSTVFTAVISAEADAGTLEAHTFGDCRACAYSPDPVNLGTGVFTLRASDLELPGRALPLAFARRYNSADSAAGSLGPGWTHSYDWRLGESGATVHLRRGDGRRETYLRNTDGSYAAPPDTFDVLVQNGDGTFTLTLTSQVAYHFATDGRLSRISEPAGNQITLTYTGSDLTLVTDTVGRQVAFTYSGGRLVQLQDPLGRKVTYGYDAEGRLSTVTDRIGNAPGEDPAQHRWQYAYDGATRHLTTITDPDGRVRVRNTYDAQGRVTQQRDGLNHLTTITYGVLVTATTDPRGHEATYTFDDRMRVLSQTDVVGTDTYTVSYTYDAAGNRTSVTDREGNTTDLTYDARGNVLSKTDPSPDGVAPRPVTTFEYDLENNLTETTDALGAVTTLTYEPAANVLLSVARQVDASTTATTSYEYGDQANPGLPTRVYSPLGNAGGTPDPTFSTVLAYDTEGNLTSRTDADGATTTFAYDDVGRLTSFIDPDGNAPGGVPSLHTWTIGYDPNDREIRRSDPLSGELEYSYDGAGNRTSLADRNGNVTSYFYDANARLREVQQKPDPAGATVYTTTVERDENGNATRITQGKGALTDYAFDALDRLTAVTTYPTPTAPLTTTYVLNGNGQPTSRTTGDGVTVTYSSDALARLTGVSGPLLSIGYEYDALGRRTSMSDALGLTTYDYDDTGRVLEISSPLGTLGYDYDLDGNRILLEYPGGDPVIYSYSPGGRLESVTDWAARTSTYTYTPSGLVDTLAQHGGLAAAYTYDRAQRLTSLEYTQTVAGLPVTVLRQDFSLDAEGNRTQLVESGALGDPPPGPSDTFSYEYDGLSRLLSADAVLFGGGTRSETFTYDAATNIQARTGPAATYTMDGANRVTTDGAQSFTWDGADRLVQRGADTFRYDSLSRLTAASVAGATSSYQYDGDGLLAIRSDSAGSTNFAWDTSTAPAPLLEAGSDRVVHGLSPLYLARADGQTVRLVRDALGSVRAELDDLGLVAKAFRYAAYGAITDRMPLDATPTLLGFTGELADPSGLTYLRARWYDPDAARFLSRDPYPGFSSRPASLNAYAYAHANPSLMTDPSGQFPPLLIALIPAIWAGLEVALSVADAVSAVQTVADPKASAIEKISVSGLFVFGLLTPGGGHATVGRAVTRNLFGGRAPVDEVLRGAERWLGPGYKEIDNGVFRSADGARQFRMGARDLTHPKGAHVSFEAISPDGRTIIENTHVRLAEPY